MAKIQSLNAAKRERSGTSVAKKLRRNGQVPAVIYGGKQDNYGVVLNAIEIRDLLSHSASENTLVRLDIEGAKEQNKLALIQDVQHHPITGSILHVDFQAVSEDEELETHVSVELVGQSVGVKHGGLLDQQRHTLDVRCRPADLPEKIVIDVSELEIGQPLVVGDITWPEGVSPVPSDDTVVAIVSEIRVEREEEEEAPELGEPELVSATSGETAESAED